MAEGDPAVLADVVTVAEGLDVEFTSCPPGEPFGDDRVALPATATVLREPAPGGFIDPRRMLAAQLAVAEGNGATVLTEEALGVDRAPQGRWRVHVVNGNVVDAGQVVIAAGPHADELAGLPRRPHIDAVAESVVLARVAEREQQRLAGLPSIIVDDPTSDHLYVVPPTEYPDGHVYVKLGATRRTELVLSPAERREWMAGSAHQADLDWLRELLLGVLPGLRAEDWSTKPCLIPYTPTRLPYLEITETGCVMAVGGNGYAAKSADAIGALATGLVLNGAWTDTELDADAFRLISR
jgi:sarcosine oxidase